MQLHRSVAKHVDKGITNKYILSKSGTMTVTETDYAAITR